MDSALRTISYIADIGSIVVLMARQRMSQASSEDFPESPDSPGEGPSQYRMICYVFESEDVSFTFRSCSDCCCHSQKKSSAVCSLKTAVIFLTPCRRGQSFLC